MADEFEYCETLVREADKDRFVSALFVPTSRRRALHALYAFNVELARIRELAREPMPGEIRLQWWRDVLGGQPSGEAGPVATALVGTVVRYRLPMRVVSEMIEARSFDLYDDPMGSMAELEAYAEKTSSGLMRLAAQVLDDGKEPGLNDVARHAGIAYAIAGLLTAFRVHVARRQLYVPLDLMERFGGRPENVLAGHATPALLAALAELRNVARKHLARVAIADIPAALTPAFLPAALVGPTLKRLERDAANPFAARPLPQWRRQWLLWRAARDPRRIAAA
jgi:phytoene synthase